MTTRTVALGRSDRTADLLDGRVPVAGHAIAAVSPPTETMFQQAFEAGAYCASELSFSHHLRLTVAGTCPYAGLPVFPSRSFRHGTFYCATGRPLRGPEDLAGRRVGVRDYGMTAALAARGALRDQYDVDPAGITWIVGDVEARERDRIVLPELHRPVRVEVAPEGRFLVDLLIAGEIDALLAYKAPALVGRGDGPVRRLIPDPAEEERRFFRETGLFPVMHLVGVRHDVAQNRDGFAEALYGALVASQVAAIERLRREDVLGVALPWIADEVRRTLALMGEDYWPCGLAGNRAVLRRMIAWSFADGLIPREPEPEELFLPAFHHS